MSFGWRLLFVLAVLYGAVGPAKAEGSWTFLFYMVTDDDASPAMEDCVIRNIQSLCSVGTPAGVNVLVQHDRGKNSSALIRSTVPDSDYKGAARYRLSKDKWEYLEKVGEQNSGDPKVLLDFVRWGLAQAPADHVVLVVDSHGSGVMSWRGPGAVGSALPGEVRLDSYVAYDDTDNDCLTLPELSRVLEVVAKERGGRPIDILSLEACLPMGVEALYQLRNGCRLLVGSSYQVPMGGFEYSGALRALWSNPTLGAESVAEVLVKSFIDNTQGDQVMSAFRTSGAADLTGAVEKLAQEMLRVRKQTGKLYLGNWTITCYELHDQNMYWDLDHIALALAHPTTTQPGATNESALREAASEVSRALRATRPSEWFRGKYSDAKVGGMSIFWPDAKLYKQYRSYYKALEFSQATHWDDYIDSLHFPSPAN